MKRSFFRILSVCCIIASLAACGGSYYRVKDPATGNVYYTDKIEKEKGGAVRLKDANTGSVVTLQSSEVAEINKEEYKANTKKN